MTIRRLLRSLKSLHKAANRRTLIERYLASGQKPWTEGYWEYRADYINSVLQSDDLMNHFRLDWQLPEGYGFRLDERVVEYPWVLSRLDDGATWLLDAGGTLSYQYLLALPVFSRKSVVVYTLAPDGEMVREAHVSYVYGDLRSTILRDGAFKEIVCISTLEHIGMDNTFMYTSETRYRESKTDDYRLVLQEFRRLLAPDGRLFITVPYGQYQDCGWLQQFDRTLLEDAIQTFGSKLIGFAFYRYYPEGWRRADATACEDCKYFDFHHEEYEPDYIAAARAVACVELVKG